TGPALLPRLAGGQERAGRQVLGVEVGGDRRPLHVVELGIDPDPPLLSLVPVLKSEEHTSELQSRRDLVCRLLLEKKKKKQRLEIQSFLGHGWRFVTDYNQLYYLTFRLAFADSIGEAINSEVRSYIFFNINLRDLSL